MIPPTPKMARCMAAIREMSANGVAPSIGELATHLGYASKGTLHGLLSAMKARGLVTWEPDQARTLRLVTPEISRADLSLLPDEQLRRIASWSHSILADRA